MIIPTLVTSAYYSGPKVFALKVFALKASAEEEKVSRIAQSALAKCCDDILKDEELGHLKQIPHELLVHILSFCKTEELSTFRLTSYSILSLAEKFFAPLRERQAERQAEISFSTLCYERWPEHLLPLQKRALLLSDLIKENGRCLAFGTSEIRRNRELVLAAVEQKGTL